MQRKRNGNVKNYLKSKYMSLEQRFYILFKFKILVYMCWSIFIPKNNIQPQKKELKVFKIQQIIIEI